jgi:two-component system, response regulator, stage 0 sporulation protein F
MIQEETLLYLDDEPVNLMLFTANFEEHFIIKTAESGREAFNLLGTHPEIKVVICDLKMPEMNGIDFIKKAKEQFSDKIFFLLTGYHLTDEILEALKSGLIHQYFCKPFEADDIEYSIRLALK